jgi:hypothetical protein
MVGVLKGLNLPFADAMADRWPGLRNSGAIGGARGTVANGVERDGAADNVFDDRRTGNLEQYAVTYAHLTA